jgi:hypothetical protein
MKPILGGKLNSVIPFGFLVLFCVATYLISLLLYKGNESIRVFGPYEIALVMLGFVPLILLSYAGFPQLIQKDIPNRTRFHYPLIIGFVFGLADLLVYIFFIQEARFTSLPPFTQPFPYSIFLYGSGAIYTEVYYRLLPIVLWVAIWKWLVPKSKDIPFWIAVILTSLIEPIDQRINTNFALLLYSILSGFLFNFLQAVYFRKAGFLSNLSIRLGHYFAWHILFGMCIQFFILA